MTISDIRIFINGIKRFPKLFYVKWTGDIDSLIRFLIRIQDPEHGCP